MPTKRRQFAEWVAWMKSVSDKATTQFKKSERKRHQTFAQRTDDEGKRECAEFCPAIDITKATAGHLLHDGTAKEGESRR